MPYTVEQYKKAYESYSAQGLTKEAARVQDAFRSEHPSSAAAYFAKPQPIPGEAEAAPAAKPRTFVEEQARGLGLATRAIAPALAGAATGAAIGSVIPGVGTSIGGAAGALAGGISPFAADLYALGKSKITGKQPEMYPSQALEQALTKIGLPEPQDAFERGAVNVIGQIPGIYAPQTLARGLISGPAPAVAPTSATGRALGLLAGPEGQTTGAAAREALMQGTQAVAGEIAAQNAPEGWGEYARPLAELAVGAAGVAGPGAISRATRNTIEIPGAGMVPSQRTENVRTLQEAGVPLTPAMTTGNPVDLNIEAALKTMPTSAMRVARAEDATQAGFTRALMRLAGIDSPVATPEVLATAQRNFGNEFEELYGRLGGLVDAKNDEAFLANAFAVERELRGTQNVNADRLAAARQRLTNAMSGEVNPELIQRNLEQLNTNGWSFSRSNDPEAREYGAALLQLREQAIASLEAAAARGGNEDLAEDLANLHQRYARFKAIEETMSSASGGADKLNTGFIPATAIAANAKRFYRGRYAQESDDPWMNLIRAGEAAIPNPVPNSGTAQRQYYRDLLSAKPIGVAGATAAAALAGGNVTGLLPAAGTTAVGLGLPWEAARRWYSPIPGQGIRPMSAFRQPTFGLLTARPQEEE
jgi:hypothetical protein